MRLTIIPIDKAVYQNGVCYANLDWVGTPKNIHALQWFDTEGWIEFNDGNINEDITELPQWAVNAQAAWSYEHNKPLPDPLPPTAEQNKAMASKKLFETDWTDIPNISDPSISNPYLINTADFIVYRNTLRSIATNPISGYIDWPIKPMAVWS